MYGGHTLLESNTCRKLQDLVKVTQIESYATRIPSNDNVLWMKLRMAQVGHMGVRSILWRIRGHSRPNRRDLFNPPNRPALVQRAF